ncbi:MAG: cell division protein ZapA [Desulfovibrionaceae bacterium]
MPRYTLDLLGMTVAFRTDADEARIQAAQNVLEARFGDLAGGGSVSKEKLLACVGLSLADDLLQSEARLARLEAKISELLEKCS